MLTSLTKENFWNDLADKYPEEMKHFCAWIDEYKKRVDWDELFNSNSTFIDGAGEGAPAPKYHDLPIAMQIGIFIQYYLENPRKTDFALISGTILRIDDFATRIRLWFDAQHAYWKISSED